MARKRKASRRRSPKVVSLLNVAESYAYANVLTSGLMGTTPVGFITGATDLGYKSVSDSSLSYASSGMVAVGGGSISFCLLYTSPSPRDRSLSRMPSSA